jgi:hypothetical protein
MRESKEKILQDFTEYDHPLHRKYPYVQHCFFVEITNHSVHSRLTA